MVHLTELEPTT